MWYVSFKPVQWISISFSCFVSFLTSQKIPECPAGQLHVAVRPSASTHCPPCRHGALSQGLGPVWQYFPEKPDGHKHLDPDSWSCNKCAEFNFTCHEFEACLGSDTSNNVCPLENKQNCNNKLLLNGGGIFLLKLIQTHLTTSAVQTQTLTAAVPWKRETQAPD